MLGIYMVVHNQVSNPDYPPDGPIIVVMLLILGKPRNICLKVISHQYMGTCGWSSSRGPVLIIPQMVPHVPLHHHHLYNTLSLLLICVTTELRTLQCLQFTTSMQWYHCIVKGCNTIYNIVPIYSNAAIYL